MVMRRLKGNLGSQVNFPQPDVFPSPFFTLLDCEWEDGITRPMQISLDSGGNNGTGLVFRIDFSGGGNIGLGANFGGWESSVFCIGPSQSFPVNCARCRIVVRQSAAIDFGGVTAGAFAGEEATQGFLVSQTATVLAPLVEVPNGGVLINGFALNRWTREVKLVSSRNLILQLVNPVDPFSVLASLESNTPWVEVPVNGRSASVINNGEPLSGSNNFVGYLLEKRFLG